MFSYIMRVGHKHPQETEEGRIDKIRFWVAASQFASCFLPPVRTVVGWPVFTEDRRPQLYWWWGGVTPDNILIVSIPRPGRISYLHIIRPSADSRHSRQGRQQQTTDNRQQTTDNRQQTIDNRQQTTDHRPQTTGNRQQTADNRQQTTDNRQQTTGSMQQTVERRQQAADSKQQTAVRTKDSRQQICFQIFLNVL